MTTVEFLAEWALRSSILILGGALLLWALRVKDSSVRLAAWTAMLLGSLAIPALTALPKIPFPVMHAAAPLIVDTPVLTPFLSAPSTDVPSQIAVAPNKFNWTHAALTAYGLIAVRAPAASGRRTRAEPASAPTQPRDGPGKPKGSRSANRSS